MLTIHCAETRNGNHHSKEDAAQGAEEGATEVQSDSITASNGILERDLRFNAVCGECNDVPCQGLQSMRY